MNDPSANAPSADLLIRDISTLVVEPGVEIPDAWLAVSDNRVAAYGRAGEEPEAAEVRSAGGRLVTPGLVNTHHHMYQNLTRSFGPVVNGTLFDWLTGLYPLWTALDDESVYLSSYVAMAELLLGGCTASSDHLYVHPRPGLVDAQVRAAQDVGLRFLATRGSMSLSVEDGGLPPR
ncbi:amidohydrolase family protein, partial [Actinomadura adrarensis]